MKIESKDLRVGNWVKYKGDADIIVGIFGNYIYFDGSDSDYDIIYIKGIELSPEILEKAGFDVYDTVGGFLCWEKGKFKLLDRKLPAMVMPHIIYLHQLQNLYYCLVGQELNIEL